MELSIKIGGGPLNKVWIYMHRIDKHNLTELLIKEGTDKILLRQRSNGFVVAKSKATVTIEPNIEYVFRIEFDGTLYSVFMNQTLLLTMVPGALVPNATVGAASTKTTVSIGYITVN